MKTRVRTYGATFLLVLVGSAAAFQNEFCSSNLASAAATTTGGVSLSPFNNLCFTAAKLLPFSRVDWSLSARRLPDNCDDYYCYDYDTRPISKTIVLTRQEQELIQLVKQVRDKYCPNIIIRIAGGWVRDKLLDKEPTTTTTTSPRDIDFVLNDYSGSDFARLFQQYIKEHTDDDEQESNDTHRGGDTLKEYSSKSKHLQTASLQFRNFNIDFCHLRFEKYSPDSRVPEETKRASAVQDAWRRDLTINSLFYNINTNQVEDWTERGLEDLQLGIIATPATRPLSSLLEDPLRILRAIRFAAQLSFSMDPALKKASLNKKVQEALQNKVSRVRIGNEIDLMFQTRDPSRGIQLLLEVNLMSTVFPLQDDNKNIESWKPADQASPLAVYKAGFRLLTRTQAMASRIFVKVAQWDESRRRYLWYAAFLKPFCDMTKSPPGDRPQRGGGKRSRRNGSILYQLLSAGLKRPAIDTESVERIIKGADTLQAFVNKHDELFMEFLLETNVHFASLCVHDHRWKHAADLRWMGYRVLKGIGPFWRESLILALATNLQDLAEAVQRYWQWVTLLVDRLGLDDAIFDEKPLLNGSQIKQRALPGVNGEGFKQVMGSQEEWQVRHGCCCSGATNNSREKLEAELIDYLVRTFPEYGIQQNDG